MRNINILMLVPDYPPNIFGGIGTHVYQLARELVHLNVSVTIIEGRCDFYVSEEYEESIEESIKVIRFNHREDFQKYYKEKNLDYFTFRWANNNLTMLLPIIKYLENHTFDIIHTHDFYTALIYDAIQTIYSFPSVATIHARAAKITSFDDSSRRYTRINADRIITVSQALKEEIIDRYGVDTTFPEIDVVHNGIDVSSDLEKQSLGENKLDVITYCGRIHQTKGCDVLLRAFANLVRENLKYSHFKLNLLGDGPLLDEMVTLVDSLDIKNKVIFSGFVNNSEARNTIRRAFLHIVPSTYEAFGLSALEAMAEGTCVIASSVGGIKEFIKDGENGILVPSNDVDALANAILHLLENPEKRQMLAKRGLETARENKWSNVAVKIKSIYIDLLKLRQHNNLTGFSHLLSNT